MFFRSTADGLRLELMDGGARLLLDGETQHIPSAGEYPALYARFAELVESGGSDVDIEPLRITADAFLIGAREIVESFN